jgi:hypothetical protein
MGATVMVILRRHGRPASGLLRKRIGGSAEAARPLW